MRQDDFQRARDAVNEVNLVIIAIINILFTGMENSV